MSDVVERIGDMLYSMTLLPGQPLRQEALAAALNVSRAPVREALRVLQSNGLVTHERHLGYAVRRLSRSELEQAYRIRELLEGELLGRLGSPEEAVAVRLREANAAMAAALAQGDLLAARRANHVFHFEMFAAAGQELVVEELQRVWRLTEAYRSYYLADPPSRQRIVAEHDEMIAAYEAGDVEGLIALAGSHRAVAAASVGALLNP